MKVPGGPIRVGLLLDDPEIPWWVAPALRKALEARKITVPFAAIRAATPEPATGSRLGRWWRNRDYLALAAFQRLDNWLTRTLQAPSPTPLESLAPAAVILRVAPRETRYSDYFRPEDVARIRALEPRLLLRIGFRILRGEILTVAPAGVWSFHHGDNRVNRGGPACLWEVLLDWPTTGITLQRITEDLDGGEVLARSVIATRQNSWRSNNLAALAKSPHLLTGALSRLDREGLPAQGASAALPWSGYSGRLYQMPTNREVLTHLPRLAARRARPPAGRSRRWQWSLGWVRSGGGDIPHGAMHRYRELVPPPDRYWADPFPVQVGGRSWMFFEQVLDGSTRGTICVVEIGPKGPIGEPVEVLAEPFHLSFPNVIQIEGQWYMLPETAQAGEVRAYRAARFPDQWVHHCTIPGATGADPVLFQRDGHWYLFTSDGSLDFGRSEELNLFVAPSPFGPYSPHPANPIVADVRCARMAGRLFEAGGRLYRPAQIAVPHYGAGIAVMEVTELTPERYREQFQAELRPTWKPGLAGLHTLNASAGLSTIDILRRR